MSWKKFNDIWISKTCSTKFRILDRENYYEGDNFEFILSNAFNKKIKMSRIKRYIIKYLKTISTSVFSELIINYKEEYNLKNIKWDPDVFMTNVKHFVTEIKKSYFSFKNDDTSMFLISRAFDVDLIILNDSIDTKNIVHIKTSEAVLKDKLLIIYKEKLDQNLKNRFGLKNESENTIIEYSLIGFKTEDKRKKNMVVFAYNNLPIEVSKLLNNDMLYTEYIDKIMCEEGRKLELNEIIKKLQTSKSIVDSKEIIEFINENLNKKKYFSR
jgi:hypothetical protein